jgi:Lon protease-like protein
MKGQWKEVVRLAFRGQRFEDHALDLNALGELSQFQKMVAETAEALWRTAHPDRERLPPHFEERTRLCLRRIEEGSAVAPLEVLVEEPEQRELFEPEAAEIDQAIALAHEVFQAVEKDAPLPESLPKSLVSEYQQWGQRLAEDEAIELITVGKTPARVTAAARLRLAAFADTSHEDRVDITGEVLEADIRLRHFQVWLNEKVCVKVDFSPEQEDLVTSALRDHRTLGLRIIGRGEVSPQGTLLRVTQVAELRLQPLGEVPYDANARPIEDVLAELAGEVPQEDWKRLPPDLTENLDQYLYGTPKP